MGFPSKLLAACLLLFASCATCGPPPPETGPPPLRGEEAIGLVWNLYGQTRGEEPRIVWIHPEDLDCNMNHGFLDHSVAPPRCVSGLAWETHIVVALPQGFALSRTALAHELWHYGDELDGADGDPDHEGPGFAPGGDVDRANAALRDAGM